MILRDCGSGPAVTCSRQEPTTVTAAGHPGLEPGRSPGARSDVLRDRTPRPPLRPVIPGFNRDAAPYPPTTVTAALSRSDGARSDVLRDRTPRTSLRPVIPGLNRDAVPLPRYSAAPAIRAKFKPMIKAEGKKTSSIRLITNLFRSILAITSTSSE